MEALSFNVDPIGRALGVSVTVLLARHGTHDEVGHVLSGRSDIALNAAGREQARCLATRLFHASIGGIFTSPRRRAYETAIAVAEQLDLTPISTSTLDEIDFGEWSGRRFVDLEADARWRFWNAERGRASTPSGATIESATMCAVRHLEACDGVGVMLCVSHCDIIRGLVAYYLGLDADRLLSFDIDPASVTTIELADGRGRVVAVNERVC